MSVRGAAGHLAASLALVVAAAVPAGATTDPSGSPSTDGAPADAALVQEAEEALRADHARVEGAQVTPEMTADATFSLRADDPTFALRPEDSTITLEKTQETKDDTVVTLTSDLLFEFGKAALTPEAKAAVAELAADVPQDATVRVDGYTDSIGTDAKNLTLSKQRAEAVADILAERSDLTLETEGHGEADPVAENEVGGEDNPAGRALNRRVEVTYPTS